MTVRHPIWFERPILPDLVAEVTPLAETLGPGTEAEPFFGIGEATGAMAGSLLYDAAAMDRAPRLRVIARTGIGTDRVDIAAATTRGIAVCNTPDGPTVSTAEHAIALMLAASKALQPLADRLRSGRDEDLSAIPETMELDGRTLGLVGYGRIARRVAAIGAGLGMEVVAFDPYLADDAFAGVARAGSLGDVLAAADVVSVHIPLTAESRHTFDAAAFAAMREGAVFVNTARGGLVDQEALLAALDSRLLAAGLDVTDPEPLPPDHPLLNRADVIVTPHVASGTHAGKRRMFRMAFRQVVQVLDGELPDHLVNQEAAAMISKEEA